ncbi:diguanylate cyclase domain-containing protein [Clostridium intestinale]|uniref:PAS domain S-box-containing protein/diguanylate cyclase (GGDEF) domain-containing protein n=1 Tax=Clostridium intestinale DSM 6191 TaxID=1121320 RepID=A0A1M5YNK8_9CLOT|nr:diguanylate cyclase [Clostridium intestinale]SHI13685.1 PAS domain S-box-containing protein/diguanylate cyclase (GGDEF) domain-containing protein [Clostridium intestinale DSM 6191]
MDLVAALSLLTFIIYVFIGVHTFKSSTSSAETKLFLLLCLSLSIWSLGYFLGNIPTFFASEPLMKLAAIGWCTFTTFVLHIALRFTNNKLFKNKLLQVLLYVPSIFLIYVRVFLHWEGISSTDSIYVIFSLVNTIYNISYQSLSLIVIAIWGKRQLELNKKRQAVIVVSSSAASFGINFLSEAGILPAMGQFYALIMVLGIYYAIIKYNLLKIPSDILFDEILAEMMDLFFLVSPTGEIIEINKRTVSLLGYSEREILNMRIEDLFSEKETVKKIVLESPYDKHIYQELNCITALGKQIPMDVSCKKIIDEKSKKVISTVIIGHDITLTKKLEYELHVHEEIEEKLRVSEEKFRVMFSEHSAIMLLIDPENLNIFSANASAQKFYGYDQEDFEKMKITDLNGAENLGNSDIGNNLKNILDKSVTVIETTHRLSNGEMRNVEVHPSPIKGGDKIMVFAIIHDITERKKAEEYITYLAYHDALTGLVNRKYFVETLEEELRLQVNDPKKLALIFCDLDEFKYINDTFGHGAGDFVLCEVGNRIKDCIKGEGIVARLGGDEFAIILFNIENYMDAEKYIYKINGRLQIPMKINGNKLNIRASMGISVFPDDGTSVDDLLKNADREMYSVKRKNYENVNN